LGEPSTKDALVAALQDPDHNVRRTAVEALATFQDPRFIDLFIRLTKEPGGDTSIRRESTRALTAIQEPRSTEFLLECVRDFDTEVRQLAIRELGRRKERRAVPALIESLSDKEWGVRFAARSALAGISGQAFGDDAKKWQSWWSKQSKQ
jgi:HEAT repeat protein